VPLDLYADEDGQAEPGAQPADLRAVPGDDAAGLQRLYPAQAGRGGQGNGIREIDVGDPAIALEPLYDGTIHPVWNMFRHEDHPIPLITQ